MWYIYKHTNKINHKVYIGKAKNINSRWAYNGYKYKKCPRFWSAIIHYGWDNFFHEIILENVPDNKVDELEQYYIEYYQATNPQYGYNLSSGGTGGNIWENKPNEEKISYSQKRREETLSRGDEWHLKLSEGQKKSWLNDISRKEKASSRMSGGRNHQAKKCMCIETNTIYNCYSDAAEACGKSRTSGSKIGEVIKGKRKTFAGYHWKGVE